MSSIKYTMRGLAIWRFFRYAFAYDLSIYIFSGIYDYSLNINSLREYLIFRPKLPFRVFNTWMGDPGKLILLENIIEIIKSQDLLSQVQKTGKRLKCGLLDLEKEFCNLINSVRGRGTFLAANAATPELRDDILKRLKQKG